MTIEIRESERDTALNWSHQSRICCATQPRLALSSSGGCECPSIQRTDTANVSYFPTQNYRVFFASYNSVKMFRMASYMPQDLFDICVVTSILLHKWTDEPLEQFCTVSSQQYQNDFPDDTSIKIEMEEAAARVLKMMRSQFEEKQLSSAMTQLQFCITNYELDGAKKRKRLLGGTWFTRQKSRNPDRIKDCLRNIVIYHSGTMTGLFPIAPDGWSFTKC